MPARTPEATLIPQRVERQAAATPDAIAVTCAGESLDYRHAQSPRQSARASPARARRRHGTIVRWRWNARSDGVGWPCSASSNRAAAYLPIDLAYPPDRIEFTLTDAGAAIMLVSAAAGYAGPAVARALCRLLVLDRDWAALAGTPTHDPDPRRALSISPMSSTPQAHRQAKGCDHPANVARLSRQRSTGSASMPAMFWTFFHSHAFDSRSGNLGRDDLRWVAWSWCHIRSAVRRPLSTNCWCAKA